MQLVLQTTVCDCLSFDPFAFEEDGLSPSEVDVGRREIGQALAPVRRRSRDARVCLVRISYPIVGMTNSASDRAPVGQRVVMVLSRV